MANARIGVLLIVFAGLPVNSEGRKNAKPDTAPAATAQDPVAKKEEAKVHFISGRFMLDGGDYELALKEFMAARDLYYLPEIDRFIGQCLEKLHRISEAMQ